MSGNRCQSDLKGVGQPPVVHRPGSAEGLTELPTSPVPIPSLSEPDRPSELLSDQIYLQPRGLVSHDLFLGVLATEATGRVWRLTVLQLFDLATVLDAYETEIQSRLEQRRWPSLRMPPEWLRTAAIAAITAGLTTVAVQWVNRPAMQLVSVPAVGSANQQPAGKPLSTLPVPKTLATSPQQLPPVPAAEAAGEPLAATTLPPVPNSPLPPPPPPGRSPLPRICPQSPQPLLGL
ncbi:hypothetical protein DO97_03345 [Neosynechococcus sphagnicola sy1]|uniref:Uncharacterized protein n=1 Tax=Neosynechococcus sphagnicola sy1 TaxID=1497020 RepID=A0A098TL96_9CYAN|nr:DUF4335 domain-containing protein [Neosynechococcus sphagnicola]KGF73075.1 hypothetical protein DO97_03345 [Neosynechococcus sphagnicola sy1]